ncbi:hypothetical protein H2201_005483 [Coniosporium apollinis]|uniref:HIT domain-containing protein n=1 Tax=Coniosporium apollinis TaxID=61459 RepID=A0ABQ9NPU8_9PEZI|nr:hypothetical protein H2201_005483 [Coniosporium apollinis]
MSDSADLDSYYPSTCPFCTIASAFPCASSTSGSTSLSSAVPTEEAADPTRVDPNAFVLLSAPEVLAFLDILPMTRGHVLVASRTHRKKVADLEGSEASEVGFWLPLLARTVAKVTGVTDYNIVQNNGPRAAQVIPHVHFHIIPRPASLPQVAHKSWTMFGRGQRDELDDEDGVKLAREMRGVLREEVGRVEGRGRGKL